MPPIDEARLRELADRAEISDAQLRYATGVGTLDWELLRTRAGSHHKPNTQGGSDQTV